MTPTKTTCPKCNKLIEQSGEAAVPNVGLCRVFQCDNPDCEVTLDLDDGPIPCAFTFAITPAGEFIHPTSSDPIPLN
jgi:hypothetical protein